MITHLTATARQQRNPHPPIHNPAKQLDGTSRFNPHRRQKNIPTDRVTGRYNATT